MTSICNRRQIISGFAAMGLAVPALPAMAASSSIDRTALDKGHPLKLVISIAEQKAHVYAGSMLIGSSRISSGKPGHDTPQGIFTVLEKRRHHSSNLYSNAPMPFMQRLTWSGIALHEGPLPGYPASHGCIRLTRAFASDLFSLQTIDRHVIIAEHMPEVHDVNSPLLFQPRLAETASLEPSAVSSNDATTAPLRIYLTRHTGKHRLERVQFMLSRLGFYEGPPDGLMGDNTWRAIVAFQKSIRMKPTGVLRGQTLALIETAYGIEETPAGHLYVRQGKEPVFDMPLQLEQSHEMLGTHLFTMGAPEHGSGKVAWTTVTVTGDALGGAGAALAALQRFKVPAEVRTRIERMLTPQSSLAISDTGLGPETGKGTDFIVITR